MNIIFTCGGTAGHINPAVALARLMQIHKPDCRILFVGAKGGMEERLVPAEGFALETVTISSFKRKLNWSGMRSNVKTLKNLSKSRKEAEAILRAFSADLVVGTGGYASYPVLREAARLGIPTAVHESNAVPGLTTKRLSHYVDLVMVGLPDTQQYYRHPERVVVTGTPVRGDFFSRSKQEAKRELGIPEDMPVVLSYWGSLGATVMNRLMVDFLELEAKHAPAFYHIHGAGQSYGQMKKELEERQVTLPEQLQLREYIYDMPCIMAAADLVLSRAGASTLSELTALGKPAILVPSPNVTNHHQEKNAQVLGEKGGALVMAEASCSGALLYDTTVALLQDEEGRKTMRKAMSAAGNPEAGDQIYQSLMNLTRKH